MMSILPENLKKLRKQYGYTQKKVAEYLGITESAYGYYEQGRNEPSNDSLHVLARLFDTSIDELLGREEPTFYSPVPDWATEKDKIDLKRIIEEQAMLMFDGVPVTPEARQRAIGFFEAMIWDAKQKERNKEQNDS